MTLDPRVIHLLDQFEAWVTDMAAALMRLRRRMVEEAHVPPAEADEYIRMIAERLFGPKGAEVIARGEKLASSNDAL